MHMLEIYSDSFDTVWRDTDTFLVVYDSSNNIIADYDFQTGLKLLQKDDQLAIYIEDENLVPGRWKFLGTKVKIVDGQQIDTKVSSEGFKEGQTRTIEFEDDMPWKTIETTNIKWTSRTEREHRLAICKTCPFFDPINILCTINGQMILDFTKRDHSICPEEKWGDKAKVNQEAGLTFDFDDQQDFERELEEFLKGI